MFTLAKTEINADKLKQRLQQDQCGGFCSFEGWVRNHNDNKAVDYLAYSAYEELAITQGNAIVKHSLETYDIKAAACVHRIGTLQIGDMAVWVGVSAAHRNDAFLACRYIIDTLKADVPIWKKEFYSDKQVPNWLANPENLHQ